MQSTRQSDTQTTTANANANPERKFHLRSAQERGVQLMIEKNERMEQELKASNQSKKRTQEKDSSMTGAEEEKRDEPQEMSDS